MVAFEPLTAFLANRANRLRVLGDAFINPLYEATVDASEEAILDSMVAAETLDGIQSRVASELPIDLVKSLLED